VLLSDGCIVRFPLEPRNYTSGRFRHLCLHSSGKQFLQRLTSLKLFQHPNQEFLLRASYLEIYNEQLKDLLSPETQGLVKIRQDEQKRFFVSPLREEVVTSEAQVAALLLRGEANRHTGSTDYNARSSRSHTVFQMIIESRQATGESTDLAKSIAGKVITPNMSKLAQMGGGAVNISRLVRWSRLAQAYLDLQAELDRFSWK
jgi:hypothetical protein